ncbi:MAG: radical SAM protein [Candidatus Latescibacterota bacterium]
MIKIIELFPSIQGESSLQGFPCVFVRLSGCNLNCSYCDTRYAREGGTEMAVDEIVGKVMEYAIPFACITGGEPLLQKETPELAGELLERGLRVSVETNGSMDHSAIPRGAARIIDIKCPGSGEHGKVNPVVLVRKRQTDEFKFVLVNRDDFEFARDYVRKHGLTEKNTVLFSPAGNTLSPAVLAEWLIDEMPEARLNLQIHRFIWPHEPRGR